MQIYMPGVVTAGLIPGCYPNAKPVLNYGIGYQTKSYLTSVSLRVITVSLVRSL